jgi:hypothetical protein
MCHWTALPSTALQLSTTLPARKQSHNRSSELGFGDRTHPPERPETHLVSRYGLRHEKQGKAVTIPESNSRLGASNRSISFGSRNEVAQRGRWPSNRTASSPGGALTAGSPIEHPLKHLGHWLPTERLPHERILGIESRAESVADTLVYQSLRLPHSGRWKLCD